MTELEIKIDQELGNDTEHFRNTMKKYVNWGRTVAEDDLKARGMYTLEEAQKMAQSVAADAVHTLIQEFELIMKQAKEAQDVIEAKEEDAKLAALAVDENGKVLYGEVVAIVDGVDHAHAAVIRERDEKLKQLFEKFAPTT